MATTKTDTKTETKADGPINLDDILGSVLPEGMKASDLEKTGGLVPVFNSKLAFEKRLVLAGRIHILEVLPIEDEKPRVVIKVCDITVPTVGTQGNKLNQTQIEIPKGGDLLIGLSGNLKTNKELVECLMDVEHVYFGVFAVTGQMPMKKGNDMWIVDCRIARQERMKRAGSKYMLSATYAKAMARGDISALIKGEFPETNDGTPHDPVTGEVYAKVPQHAAS